MRVSCSLDKPVSVCDYSRFRFNRWEKVRAHCRSYPNQAQLSLW